MCFVAGGSLAISPLTPFNENDNVSVNCVNKNQRFRGSPKWKAPNGSYIGSTSSIVATLAISNVTRHQAGTYTCCVPEILEIPVAKFELTIHCKLMTHMAKDLHFRKIIDPICLASLTAIVTL